MASQVWWTWQHYVVNIVLPLTIYIVIILSILVKKSVNFWEIVAKIAGKKREKVVYNVVFGVKLR